jgi:hypothetical protein
MAMQIPVLVERVPGNGYRARGAEPLGLCGEGATRDEAVANLREQWEAKSRQGAEWISIELGPAPDPWMEFAGMFRDDPLIAEWKRSTEEYRQKVEDDPAAL